MAKQPVKNPKKQKKGGQKKGRVFDELLVQGIKKGQLPGRTASARKWFRQQAKQYNALSESDMLRMDKGRLIDKQVAGNMYFFMYQAKHRATLPYWDHFPLIFPIGPAPGGFYGLNFHYLPLPLRARFMDALYTVVSDDTFDENTKLNLTYGILKATKRMRFYKACIKHYLFEQVKSRFVRIHPAEWDIALFLPLQRFQKATAQEVWRDTRKKLGVKK